MKIFLKKILLIITLLTAPIVLIVAYLTYKVEYDINIDQKTSNLFIGDSHIKFAICDSIIPNSKNMGRLSESLHYNYFKINAILKDNPGIKHIYLGVGYHSISSYIDDFIQRKESAVLASDYYYLVPTKEKISSFYWYKNNSTVFLKRIITNGLQQLLTSNPPNLIGNFSNPYKESSSNQKSMDKRFQTQFVKNNSLRSFSKKNIHYFKKIVNLCKEKEVNLTIVNTPVHHYLLQKTPQEYKKKLNDLIKTNKLDYIDLSDLELTDECFIPDGDHVSWQGAIKTSHALKKIIQERATKPKLH